MTLTAPPETPPDPQSPRPTGRWKLAKLPLVVAVVCLLGVAVLLYPAGASWFSSIAQAEQLGGYSHDVKVIGPAGREQALTDARAYNATLTGNAALAANTRLPLVKDANEAAESNYAQVLAADPYGLMARIKIPSIDADLPIFHGTSDTVLQEGIGHLEGTSLPVGGIGSHSVLTGHRGLATSTLFTHLDQVKVGDTFTIEVFGEVLTYQVNSTKVVQPDQTQSLYPQPGKDLVTLVTCTPLGINSERILVTGERILPTPPKDVASADKKSEIAFPWWMVGLGGAILLTGVYVWASGRSPRLRNRRAA
ncbi:MAG: class C sortase [Microbacteriaceae bacterium]